jgi:hypothetical protein
MTTIDIATAARHATQWFQHDDAEQAVGQFGSVVLNFDGLRGWTLTESTWHPTRTRAARDFASEVRAIEKANA